MAILRVSEAPWWAEKGVAGRGIIFRARLAAIVPAVWARAGKRVNPPAHQVRSNDAVPMRNVPASGVPRRVAIAKAAALQVKSVPRFAMVFANQPAAEALQVAIPATVPPRESAKQ
jgi:hypothetical protein